MVFHPDDWPGGDDWPDWPGDGGCGGRATASGPSDGEMRTALAKLPPGHPSSAWNADGTRRPPPPRLEDLELPLPGTWAGTFEEEPRASGDPGI